MIELRGMHGELRPYAEFAHQLAAEYKLAPVVTSVFRSWVDQLALRRRYEDCLARGAMGQEPGCKYPANRPGDSSHNYGLSWDSWVPDADMPLWIAIRRYVGFTVPDNDAVHAELPEWRTYLV